MESSRSGSGLIYRNLMKVKPVAAKPPRQKDCALRSLSREARKSMMSGLADLVRAPVKMHRKTVRPIAATKKVESPKIIRQKTMPIDTSKMEALQKHFNFARNKQSTSKRISNMSCNEHGFASSTESGSPDVTNFFD